MIDRRTTARIVGVLFIVASATAIIGGSLLLPLDEEAYLVDVAANEAQVVTGVIFEIILAFSVIGIAAMLFPVLRDENEGLSLTYVGVRIVEGVLVLAATTSALLVLSLSQDANAASGQEGIGDILLSTRDWTYLVGTVVVFGVSAVILNTLLYRSLVVPRWLSVWGVVGALLLLTSGALELYGQDLSGTQQGLFAAAIGIQEMVLAIWLIVKGFAPAGDVRHRELVNASR